MCVDKIWRLPCLMYVLISFLLHVYFYYILFYFCHFVKTTSRSCLSPVCTDGAGGSPYGNGGSPYSHEGPSPVNGAFPISTATGMTEMLQVYSN